MGHKILTQSIKLIIENLVGSCFRVNECYLPSGHLSAVSMTTVNAPVRFQFSDTYFHFSLIATDLTWQWSTGGQ